MLTSGGLPIDDRAHHPAGFEYYTTQTRNPWTLGVAHDVLCNILLI